MCKEEVMNKGIKDTENKNVVELTRKQKEKIVYKKLTAFIVLSVLIVTFINNVYILLVPTSSMYPTIPSPCFTVGSKYKRGTVERFDIVSITLTYAQSVETGVKPNNTLCKRVIGLGGEKVEIKNGLLYINDEYVEENFLSDDCKVGNYGPFYVPENCVFLMGDNRNDSWDSRKLDNKYFPEENIITIAHFVVGKDGIKKLDKVKEKR